jgi:hypothetical protein
MEGSSRTQRSSSRVKGQFKARSNSSSEEAVQVGVQEPSQRSLLVGPGRRGGPVGPDEFKQLPVISKSY